MHVCVVYVHMHVCALFQVWAVDNRRLTYVRVGITDAMPIGREWVHVPGVSYSSPHIKGALHVQMGLHHVLQLKRRKQTSAERV